MKNPFATATVHFLQAKFDQTWNLSKANLWKQMYKLKEVFERQIWESNAQKLAVWICTSFVCAFCFQISIEDCTCYMLFPWFGCGLQVERATHWSADHVWTSYSQWIASMPADIKLSWFVLHYQAPWIFWWFCMASVHALALVFFHPAIQHRKWNRWTAALLGTFGAACATCQNRWGVGRRAPLDWAKITSDVWRRHMEDIG